MLDYPLPPQGLSVCHMSKWSHHVLSEVLDHQEFLPQTSELNINWNSTGEQKLFQATAKLSSKT